MTLKFNPRITKDFASYVLGDLTVKEQVEKHFGKKEEEMSFEDKESLLEFTQSILIKGFTCFDVDVNKIINKLKEV